MRATKSSSVKPPPRDAMTACAWMKCGNPVRGIDPQRTCPDCQAAGAPTRVEWAAYKATLPPEQVFTTGEMVLVLANAHMSEMAMHHPKDTPKRDEDAPPAPGATDGATLRVDGEVSAAVAYRRGSEVQGAGGGVDGSLL